MGNKWCFKNKILFAADRVVQVTVRDESKQKNEKIRDFMTKELLGIRIYFAY